MKLEFDTTMYFLKKHLPKKGLILDAGCGAGRYSIELAKSGYDVIMFDLSPKQLEIAKKQAKHFGVLKNIKAVKEGSIVNQSEFNDNSFDAVICLGGSLSHLIKKGDREKAVLELVRIAKKNSPIIVSVIGLYGVLVHELTKNPQEIENHPDIFEKIVNEGDYEGQHNFMPSHYFSSKELKELFENKATILEMIGLEGLSSHHNKKVINLYKKYPNAWKIWWKTHIKTCTNPVAIEMSEHIMLICTK